MKITKSKDFVIRFDTETKEVQIETVGDDTYLIEFKASKIKKVKKDGTISKPVG